MAIDNVTPKTIGHYQIADVLGKGAFGVVYKALDPTLGRHVAIKKLLRQQSLEGVDTQKTFAKEAQDTAGLTHKNIVTVYGFGTDTDQAAYLVMEYLQGTTLAQVIERMAKTGRDMPLAEKLEIMEQVAEGLQYAHSKGIIHRDIKPANIILLSDGTAKVLDFGVAPEGYAVGTPDYMAPEQFTGHESDIQTDVFSYGTVFYELLTARRAFDPAVPSKSQKTGYQPPAINSVVDGKFPDWLGEVVAKLMARQRRERAESLEQILLPIRPRLTRIKSEHAAELEKNLTTHKVKGNRTDYEQLINTILRLDPLNRAASFARGGERAEQAEKERERARTLLEQGETLYGRGDFDRAFQMFQDAVDADPESTSAADAKRRAYAKLEDRRSSNQLLDEVLADIVDIGSRPLVWFQLSNVMNKINRAASLDPRNQDAAELRACVLPEYERMWKKKYEDAEASGGDAASQMWEVEIDRAFLIRRRANTSEDFDTAAHLLRRAMAQKTTDRAVAELAAALAEKKALQASIVALYAAEQRHQNGDLEGAIQTLYAYTGEFPRYATRVQPALRQMETELEAKKSRPGL